MRQLSLVVTCTDRKMSMPSSALHARSLPAGSTEHRAHVWQARLNEASGLIPLSSLYQGEHWVQARQLAGAAAMAGFAPQMWVASAGLGLQPITASAPAYAATFSPRHADSVGESTADSVRWWNHLQVGRGHATLEDLGRRGAVLLSLSEVYGNALRDDLSALGAIGAEAVLIGGSADIPGLLRVPARATLRSALGGTLTSLNVRMAASWLRHCAGGKLTTKTTERSWERWAATADKAERYDRTPLSDEAVKDFIRRHAQLHPDYSRTRLHRLLRDAGLACEQKRFAMLYAETMEER